jgi:hypothetical protein
MANGLNRDESGFGWRQGCIYENSNGNADDGWWWIVGSCPARGPFVTKAEAVADRNRELRQERDE